jgi:hypothetical protein
MAKGGYISRRGSPPINREGGLSMRALPFWQPLVKGWIALIILVDFFHARARIMCRDSFFPL